jgi:hypothetical protein
MNGNQEEKLPKEDEEEEEEEEEEDIEEFVKVRLCDIFGDSIGDSTDRKEPKVHLLALYDLLNLQ